MVDSPPLSVTIADERLYAFTNPYPVDGRVSWHPQDVRGFAPMNSYLFVEGDRRLLVDAGLTIHRDAVIAQLREHVGPGGRVDVFTLRQGEFDSVCNLIALCDVYDVQAVYGMYDDNNGGEMWGDYRTDRHITSVKVGREETIELGASGVRDLQAFFPALRLLNTHWVYDEATRTLLTSDSFTHVVRPDTDGPWVVTEENDTTTLDDVRRHLLETRFWWLPGGQLEPMRKGFAEIFERFDVETIAPGFGCILSGGSVVKRHVEMVAEVLREAEAAGDATMANAHLYAEAR
jgi:hypothetical protein